MLRVHKETLNRVEDNEQFQTSSKGRGPIQGNYTPKTAGSD
jgi:hypothetical protein